MSSGANYIRAKVLAAPVGIEFESSTPPPKRTLALDSLPLIDAADEPLDGCVLDSVLSDTECKRLVGAAEACKGFSWWDPSGDESPEKRSLRNADTLEFLDESLCAALWERLRHHVPERVEVTREQRRFERDLEGTWEAIGLNPHLLINRYEAGGHFAPHADGSTIVNFNERSLYTVLVYLNTCSDGGATQLLRSEQAEGTQLTASGARVARPEAVMHAVAPNAGRCLMYWHEVVHAGEPVGACGLKYCMRSEDGAQTTGCDSSHEPSP